MSLNRMADPNDNIQRPGSSPGILLWLRFVLLLAFSTTLFALSPDTPPVNNHAKIKPSGTFTWVDGRRASYIAAPVITLSNSEQMESRTISFGKILKWHDGTICNNWDLIPNHLYCAFLEDPLLGDTQLQSRKSSPGPQLLNQGYEVICEGISIGSLTDIDGRTLIVPMLNSTLNGLFEKPIDRTLMLEMARILKKRNFTSITPHLITQERFREAISAFATHLGGFNLKFYRTPITQSIIGELIQAPELREQVGLDTAQ